MSTPDETPAKRKRAAAPRAPGKAPVPANIAVTKAPRAEASRAKAPRAKAAAPAPAPAPEAAAPVDAKRPRDVRRIAAIAGLAVVGVATLYLLAMTVAWGSHHHSLTSAHADLTEKLAAEHATVNSQGADLEAGRRKLEDALAGLSTSAKQKASGQDFEVLYRSNDAGMLDCANERIEVVKEVKNRGIYITWTLHRFDDQVAAYCDEIVGYFNDNSASEESQ